ncbi:hypothetical protein EVJ58_g7003 [Rhodofomes roseus]|uniref:Peptidase C14 caspase domain-containing protein n=1 Tax=Rhodofomes roseus TaxID=34475 RepID=A0A4Y9Y4T2_9APHY|nr:hypothetical protein EVJ58_g7003 [Rhodofomes roseus]
MKSLFKVLRKKGGSKGESVLAKQQDRGEPEAITAASTVDADGPILLPPSTSKGSLLAVPPVRVHLVHSDASSAKSDAKTPPAAEEAEKAQTLVKLDTRGAESRIWALVIGINNYPIAPLNGCVADARAMANFLSNSLHVPASQMVTLFDEEASRENILSTFKQHFIENGAIAKGDGIVFFFAGHGTQEYAPDDWGLDGDIVECICPQDLDFVEVHGIPSTTLNGLFRELAHIKGDNITAIFDCCHSGKITREQRGLRFMAPPRDFKATIPPTTDDDARKWWPGRQGDVRAATNTVAASFRYSAMKSHVLLSACRAEEEAMERILEGTKEVRGFFTSTLLDVLAEHEGTTAGLTYAYLFDELIPPKPFQHPQCLGKHKNRLLWNTTIKIVDGFRIAVREGAVVVPAGRIHGIAPGTTFSVQAHDAKDRSLGTLVIVELKDLECICRCEGTPFDIVTGARAVIKDWNNEDLTLNTFIHHAVTGKHLALNKGTIPTELKDRIPAVADPEQADLSIVPQASSSIVAVERGDPLMHEFARQIIADLDKSLVQYLLTAALHFNFHLYRQPNPLNLFTTVHVELLMLREESAGVKRFLPVDETRNYFGGEHRVPAYKAHGPAVVQEAVLTEFEPFYGLKVVNDSDYDLFPYLFYFDPSDYSIEPWYEPEAATILPPLRAHNHLKVGYGARQAGHNSIKLSLPPGKDLDTGFLRMFVSTSYVDMRIVRQSAYGGFRAARLQKAVEQRELWSAWTYLITCKSSGAL